MSIDTCMIKINEVFISFSKWGQAIQALDNVSLDIAEGQWVQIIGHNGSGKSTLLKSINGSINPDRGQILIDNKSSIRMSAREISEYLFYVHQDPLLGTAPTLTLYENLMVADNSDNNGFSRKACMEKYKSLLEPLGLSKRLKQLARSLSSGERQLLALLIAGLRPSNIMLLDEPLAALDPVNADRCIDQIRRLNQKGKTILQVTHDLDMAVSNGDRTIMMSEGKIVYDELGAKRSIEVIKEIWSASNYSRVH